MTASKLGVEVGSHKLYSEDPDQQSFAVREVKLHENYDSPQDIYNDICLLFLDGEALIIPQFFSRRGRLQQPQRRGDCPAQGWGGVRGWHRVRRQWVGDHLRRRQPRRHPAEGCLHVQD